MTSAAVLLGMLPALEPMIEATFEVWRADDFVELSRWLAAWLEWPEREVFAHPGYLSLYTTTSARAVCVRWRGFGITILYPFLIRDLSREPYAVATPARDVTTPPGYGGPAVWGEGDRAAAGEAFWRAFDQWATRHEIVSEFIRFNLFHDPTLGYPGEYDCDRKNVVCDLALDESQMWTTVKPKVRKNVNTARRMGVHIEVDPTGERLDEFLAIYHHTMERNQAEAGYYHPRSYFQTLVRELSGQFCFFHARHEGRMISTELVLISADRVYSFLGGTLADAFPLRPNDLLKYEIMLWAKRQGKRWFVLGGGAKGEDGVFHYKWTFAPNGLMPFCLGRRILRPEVYAELVSNRKTLAYRHGDSWTARDDFFPAYRS